MAVNSQETIAEALTWAEEAQDSISDLIRSAMYTSHPLIDDARELLLAMNETLGELELTLDDELDELAEED